MGQVWHNRACSCLSQRCEGQSFGIQWCNNIVKKKTFMFTFISLIRLNSQTNAVETLQVF